MVGMGVYVTETEHRVRLIFRTFQTIKSRRMGCVECGNVCGRRETNTQILVEKPVAKRPLGILRATSQDSIKEWNGGL